MWKLFCCERWGCFDLSFAFRQRPRACACVSVAVSSHEQPCTCMYKLILCCLKQALVPLRLHRPCKTGSLCWMSNTNELLNIWRYLLGKGSKDWWSNFTLLWWGIRTTGFSMKPEAHSLLSSFKSVLVEINFKSWAVEYLYCSDLSSFPVCATSF